MQQYSTPIYKHCPNCEGRGYNNKTISRNEWSVLTKRYQLKFYQQKQKCNKCKASGRVIDPVAEQQRLKKIKLIKQERQRQIQKERQYQQFLNKQKKFFQYAQQNDIKQPLLQEIEVQGNFSRKMKTQAELRAQFQKKYAQQQQEIKRILRQQQQKLQAQNQIARIQAQNRRKKQKQQDQLRLQQFLNSPQGIEFLRNQQINRQQEQIEKQKRMKKYRQQQNRKLFMKICCCGECCNGVFIWSGILFVIGLIIYLSQM